MVVTFFRLLGDINGGVLRTGVVSMSSIALLRYDLHGFSLSPYRPPVVFLRCTFTRYHTPCQYSYTYLVPHRHTALVDRSIPGTCILSGTSERWLQGRTYDAAARALLALVYNSVAVDGAFGDPSLLGVPNDNSYC